MIYIDMFLLNYCTQELSSESISGFWKYDLLFHSWVACEHLHASKKTLQSPGFLQKNMFNIVIIKPLSWRGLVLSDSLAHGEMLFLNNCYFNACVGWL